MNATEEAYADHLWKLSRAGVVRRYWFEPWKLRLAANTFYTPDFLVERTDGTVEFHEVKAAWGRKHERKRPGFKDDARVKIKVAAEMYPIVAFVVVWPGSLGWEREEIRPFSPVGTPEEVGT